ncbi:hypothetical protein [Empedobacter tilapiae]|uniref:hypothetical protein n=1 Tax=Empedobacter tilapiae TaxID=2491114 RepID=UPI0028D190F3|nr:hypothetical protein [Empedobacter tilapiae]
MDKVKIISRLKSQEMTEFINYCRNILISIKEILPKETTIASWDDESNKLYSFQNSLSDFNEHNLDKILIFNKKEDVFKNFDSNDKELRIDSRSWIGFSTLIYFKSNPKNEESEISISIVQGAFEKNQTALINIEFSDTFLNMATKEVFINLLKVIEQTNDLLYAVVISNEFRRKVKISGQNLWIGYITYFKDKIKKESFPNTLNVSELVHGTVICLDEKMNLTQENINKALEIRDVLGIDVLNYHT